MNTYTKYCPNVFVAKCTRQHEKGEIITIETKYGKEAGILEPGEKLTHVKAGLYVPSKFVESFLKEWKKS